MERVELLEVRVAAVTLHRGEDGKIEGTRVGPLQTLHTVDEFRAFYERALGEVDAANAELTSNRAQRRWRGRARRGK